MTEISSLREAIVAALPGQTSYFGDTPDLRHLYVPPAHVRALRTECHLVVGTRGVGKSVWTAALANAELRKALGSSVPELDRSQVSIGFAETERIDSYPSAGTFAQLLESGVAAFDVWQAVVVRWLAIDKVPHESWAASVDWVRANPEMLARLMQAANQRLVEQQSNGLIIFDALDRLSQDWHTMDQIVRDLLRTALWLKSYSRLSAKVFLREDQFERTVTDFPDASKLLATREDLTWSSHDLHGLLWQTLINGGNGSGERLRGVYRAELGVDPQEVGNRWLLGEDAKRDTPAQRTLFKALAGPWMGRDKRRGNPYVWAVGHLADGRGRTSPRSFLAAIRQAAEDSIERYRDHQLALHYESIKRGIQKASEIRVNEIAEDYPWVRTFMEPMAGLNVPSEGAAIVHRWEQRYPDGPDSAHIERLPPQHAKRGWDGIKEDLIRLGVLELKKDGRVDMPDLYRVGFGLGRKGGVKPRT